MAAPAPPYFLSVMDAAGFYRDGQPTPDVYAAPELRNPPAGDEGLIDRSIKYQAVVDPAKLGAEAVFELSGSPCIYFAALEDADPEAERLTALRTWAWNQGQAPVLWVVTPGHVHLFDAYARPQSTDTAAKHRIDLFERTAVGLERLRREAGRLSFETGEFWSATAITRDARVDASLLSDLWTAQEFLRQEQLSLPDAHALLLRSIFVAYLQDRGLLPEPFLSAEFGHPSFVDMLGDEAATRALFTWLAQTFNGDLFPAESSAVGKDFEGTHLNVVQRLLRGTNLKTGQGALWPYRFDAIPVELISSIYQMFAHALDPSEAQSRSTHYTPTNLVDVVLSQVFRGLRPHAKVLDPACGSGVFLVDSLRRLVGRRRASGEPWTRPMVRETLSEQVYGVDVSEGSIRIAAFSLYLTALELDPKPSPPLSDLRFEPLIGTNLFASNFFPVNGKRPEFERHGPFADRAFDAIVGNPPWTRTNMSDPAILYCTERKEHGLRRPRPIHRYSPDQAFLWRLHDFVNPTTSIGLIMHGRVFFSHAEKARRVKEGLLSQFRPRALINLADFHDHDLFPKVGKIVEGARAPALIFIADGAPPDVGDSCVVASPRRTPNFREHGLVQMGAEDVRRVNALDVASDPDLLKVACWGTPRDFALIRRLRTSSHFVCLDGFCAQLGWPKPARGIEWGGGTQLDARFPDQYLASERLTRFAVWPQDLDDRPNDPVRRGDSRPEIYRGPLVVVTRGVTIEGVLSAALSDHGILYTKRYLGIPGTHGSTRWLRYLNAILNSKLAPYFLFLTSSAWGVERNEVEDSDFWRLPVRDPADASPAAVERVLAIEAHLRSTADQSDVAVSRHELDMAVFDLYGLSAAEQALVEDTVSLTIDFLRRREKSFAAKRPKSEEIVAYAQQVVSTLQPFLQTLGERVASAEVFLTPGSPLQVVEVHVTPSPLDGPAVRTRPEPDLSGLLHRIAEQLEAPLARGVTARRYLKIYTGRSVYLVKPAERRYWSRSAGLNDADTILAEHWGANFGTAK